MSIDLEQRIRERAYEIWEREGRPHHRADEHWHAAKLELTGTVPVAPTEDVITVPAKPKGRRKAAPVEAAPVAIAAAPRRRRAASTNLPN